MARTAGDLGADALLLGPHNVQADEALFHYYVIRYFSGILHRTTLKYAKEPTVSGKGLIKKCGHITKTVPPAFYKNSQYLPGQHLLSVCQHHSRIPMPNRLTIEIYYWTY
jgi:hypothetical protein